MRRRVILALALLAVLALVLWRFLRAEAVEVVTVRRGTAVEAAWASGTATPVTAADARALVAGPIGRLLVAEGDQVVAGQVVAEVDAPELAWDLAAREADLSAAETRLAASPRAEQLEAARAALAARLLQARRDARRLASLVGDGAASPQDAERARVEVRSLEAELDANVAERRDLGIALSSEAERARAGAAATAARAEDRLVRAPLTGQVLTLAVEAGEVVAPQQALLRVGSAHDLRVVAEVDEADIARVHLGTRGLVRLYAFEDRVLDAEVVAIAPAADLARRTFEVDLSLRSPPAGVRPGMTAEVNLILAERPGVLLAPAAAVRDADETGAWVWVVEGHRLRRREVIVGLRDLDWVEVRSGLAEGDHVAVTVPEDAEAGDRVAPRDAPPPPDPLTAPEGRELPPEAAP